MQKEIKLEKDKEYYYIFTHSKSNYLKHNFVYIIDISIFEKEEWEKLTEISKTLERYITKLDEYQPNYLNKGIYKNDYCYLNSIHHSDHKLGTPDKIYEDLFLKQESKNKDEEVYTNEFRKWIYENYKRLLIKYQDAKESLDETI